jgi:hypothetical protein
MPLYFQNMPEKRANELFLNMGSRFPATNNMAFAGYPAYFVVNGKIRLIWYAPGARQALILARLRWYRVIAITRFGGSKSRHRKDFAY